MAIPIPIIDGITKILDKVIPDPAQKAAVALELAKLDVQSMVAQTEVNKAEAGHRSIFVAGWRPFIGWIGGTGLAMVYIVQPAVQLWTGVPVTLNVGELMVLLGGMLGFGGLRSFDKLKGTSNDVLPLSPPTEAPAEKPRKKFLGVFSEKLPEKTPWE